MAVRSDYHVWGVKPPFAYANPLIHANAKKHIMLPFTNSPFSIMLIAMSMARIAHMVMAHNNMFFIFAHPFFVCFISVLLKRS